MKDSAPFIHEHAEPYSKDFKRLYIHVVAIDRT